MTSFIHLVRAATDPLAPYSFNRIGFELNKRGFEPGDPPSNGAGRVALVTGANSGIGFATARDLARRGFSVWLLCRDLERGGEARDSILREVPTARVELAVLDMSKLSSIRRFAREFAPRRIDVLVHNAGVLPDSRILTEDGIELTFATQVVGPFALTLLLSERISQSTDARVIFVSSGGMYGQRLDTKMPDLSPEEFDGVRAYANAKRAQVILAEMFAVRLSKGASITFASMHPGWADTPAVRSSLPKFYRLMRPLLRTPEQGADTVVWLAASPHPKGTRGEFWFDRRPALRYLIPLTRETPDEREKLFALCERLTGLSAEAAFSPLPRSP